MKLSVTTTVALGFLGGTIWASAQALNQLSAEPVAPPREQKVNSQTQSPKATGRTQQTPAKQPSPSEGMKDAGKEQFTNPPVKQPEQNSPQKTGSNTPPTVKSSPVANRHAANQNGRVRSTPRPDRVREVGGAGKEALLPAEPSPAAQTPQTDGKGFAGVPVIIAALLAGCGAVFVLLLRVMRSSKVSRHYGHENIEVPRLARSFVVREAVLRNQQRGQRPVVIRARSKKDFGTQEVIGMRALGIEVRLRTTVDGGDQSIRGAGPVRLG